jgi:site-specific DNA recombinase
MRVALYARVSTARQAQEHSIEQQLERLHTHAAAHHEEAWEVRAEHIYQDAGLSGRSMQRPGLDALRDAVAAGVLDLVLITAPDRLARNYVHQMLVLEEWEHVGCRVEFLDRPMNQDPHDQLLLQIRGAVAEYERTLIAERMRRGRLRKYQAGLLLPWTRAPYGYRMSLERPRDPAGVWVDEAEAAVVREIFTRYLEPGGTLAGLAKHLQARAIPTPSHKGCWTLSMLRRVLTNPTYTGQIYAGRVQMQAARTRQSALRPIRPAGQTRVLTAPERWIPVAQIPALVSQEQFDLVQARLAQNRQFARRHHTTHQYLLRALVSCGRCRLGCVGRQVHPGYTYYQCRGKLPTIHTGREQKCSARFIPAAQVDELVWQDLCDVLTHPVSLTQALERTHAAEWAPQRVQSRRESLRRGWVSLQQQVERLTEAYLQAVIPLPEYQRRRHELEQRRGGLAHQITQLETQAQAEHELAARIASMEDFCHRVQVGLGQASFEQQRQLVELLVDRVVVTDGEVEIRYVIPTTPASEHVRFCHLRTDYFDQRPLAEQEFVGQGEQAVLHVLAEFRNQVQSVLKEKRFGERL